MKGSRRDFLKIATAAAGLGRLRAAAAELATDRLRDSTAWSKIRSRAYRADAVVALFGVPVFSRQGVGSAAARIRESSHDDRRIVSLCFAGGADPKRARGLNYAGWTEEVALESNAALEEAASFGFVTASSSDESFEQARHRVMDGDARGRELFVVVEERHSAAGVHLRKTFVAAPQARPDGFARLAQQVRAQFAGASLTERDVPSPAAPVPATFLYAMLSVLRSPAAKAVTGYIHDGKRYQLECDKSAAGGGLTRLTGRIRGLDAKSSATFRLWLEDGSGLPRRIEFSPRSYLRISLVYDPDLKEDA